MFTSGGWCWLWAGSQTGKCGFLHVEATSWKGTPYLPTSHWPRQVMWPNPASLWEETIKGMDVKFTKGNHWNNLPHMVLWGDRQHELKSKPQHKTYSGFSRQQASTLSPSPRSLCLHSLTPVPSTSGSSTQRSTRLKTKSSSLAPLCSWPGIILCLVSFCLVLTSLTI